MPPYVGDVDILYTSTHQEIFVMYVFFLLQLMQIGDDVEFTIIFEKEKP